MKKIDMVAIGTIAMVACLLLCTPALANYNFDGYPVVARASGTVNGGVFIDSVPWAGATTLTGNFNVPTGNVIWARLYTGIWGGRPEYEGWVNVTFNGVDDTNGLGPIHLQGRNDANLNVWCSGSGKHWMYYDVTNLVNAGAENTATTTKINATAGDFDGRVYGIVLVVVYEGGDDPKNIQYWINDGSDGLNYITPNNDGTTDFAGTVSGSVTSAKLTMVHLTAYDPACANCLQFNDNALDTSMITSNTFALNSWDVASHVKSSGNGAWYSRGEDGSVSVCNAILTLESEELPDLNVTAITPNCGGYLFAKESNEICAKIENTGEGYAGAFNVRFVIDGFRTEVRIAGLAAGENTTVCINDTTIRNAGVSLTITVTADCDGKVSESDETNNVLAMAKTVVNNGYKGKRYTGGLDINTWETFELNGNLIYSLGDSYYLSSYSNPDWTEYNAGWDASELPIPGILTATIETARLFVPYTWDKSGVMPAYATMNFNGNPQTLDAHYSDEKGWGTSYPYGMLVYDVTADFDTSGNVATFTNSYSGGGGVSMRGMLLVVVYSDSSEPERTILMNEEFDLLYGGASKCTTPEEATAYAPFGSIEGVKQATLITVAPGAGPNEGDLGFNTHMLYDVWNFVGTGTPTPQIGIAETDVTSYLQAADNEAYFRSSADYMEASNAFLILEKDEEPKPDLEITDIWNNGNKIYYKIKNNGTAKAGSSRTSLTVDGDYKKYDPVRPLGAGEERTESFRYKWTCTGKSDEIKVCADYKEAVAESNETNNCRTVILAAPDLNVTEITPNCGGYLFAEESNEICAKIENIGGGDAGAFNVRFVIDGFRTEVRIAGLAAGENTTVCINDTTIRNAGVSLTITVTADCDGKVSESDETNNVLAMAKTVVNNGYKGKRYTGGEDINTWKTFELKGNLIYSLGDSYYLSSYSDPDWTEYNAGWDASELPIPGILTATIETARLFVPYTWDKTGVMPAYAAMSFNGNLQTLDAHYSDEKGWGTSYPYGMLVYDVTADFDTSANVATLTNSYLGGGGVSMRGMLLVVVYSDSSEPERTILMNEEFDLLYGGASKCTTPEEATAYAPFGSIEGVKQATLITVAPGAGPNEGDLGFNTHMLYDVWNFVGTGTPTPQIGIAETDVTSYLQAADNEAYFRSSADYMEASNAFLILEKDEEPKPDLEITDIWNNGNKIYYKIKNNGTAKAGSSRTSLTVDGDYKKYDSVRSLGAGEERTESFRYDWTCTKLSDVIKVCADYKEAVAESNERNNCKTETWECPEIELPDLVITDIWHEGSKIYYKIKNIGTDEAGSSRTSLTVDGDYKKYDSVRPLGAGDERTESFRYDWTCTGTSDEIDVCADYRDAVAESEEGNNCKTETWECPEIELPDLVITDIWHEGSKIYYKIKNIGTDEAGSSRTSLTVDGDYKKYDSVRPLGAGDERTESFRYDWTCTGTSDEIDVCADYRDAVAESEEGNNCKTETWECPEIELPDLVITDIWHEGSKIYYKIKNNGPAKAGSSRTSLTVDGDYKKYDSVRPLGAGEERTESFRYGWTCTGTSDEIEVCADYRDAVTESNEGNNCRTVIWEV